MLNVFSAFGTAGIFGLSVSAAIAVPKHTHWLRVSLFLFIYKLIYSLYASEVACEQIGAHGYQQ
jgi:hypothetical protein